MAVSLRTMVSQLALALCHRSHCQLVIRGGCRAREGHKECIFSARWLEECPESTPPNEQPLKSTTGQWKSFSRSLFLFYLYSYISGTTRVLSVSSALRDLLFLTERALSSCVYFILRRSTLGLRGQQGHGSASPHSLTSCTSLTALGTSQFK